MTTPTKLRREARWRDIVRRQMAGRAGAAEFCRREGVALSTFHWWRRRLHLREPAAVEWIEARAASLAPVAPACSGSGPAVKIGNGTGLWIEFAASPPAELLASALHALHSAGHASC